ncbi:hypothetical protein GCM10009128_08520 [Psychrosphaera haliotis]|uniref:hypothetical protein n=1 Tax=Psychrosphaera haliotis TaxID=555083 RepID=UPI0031E32413
MKFWQNNRYREKQRLAVTLTCFFVSVFCSTASFASNYSSSVANNDSNSLANSTEASSNKPDASSNKTEASPNKTSPTNNDWFSKRKKNAEDVVKVAQIDKVKNRFQSEFKTLSEFLSAVQTPNAVTPKKQLAGVEYFITDNTLTLAQLVNLRLIKAHALYLSGKPAQSEQVLNLVISDIDKLAEPEKLVLTLRLHELKIDNAVSMLDYQETISHFDNATALLDEWADKADNIDYLWVFWSLKKVSFFASLQDHELANRSLNTAIEKANSSGLMPLIVWAKQAHIKLLIKQNDLFLAEQSFKRLVSYLQDNKLSSSSLQTQIEWAQLNSQSLKYREADKRLESVYKSAQQVRNRYLQLQSLIALIKNQIAQQKLEYAEQLIKAADKVKGLTNALGRDKTEQLKTQNELYFVKAQIALLKDLPDVSLKYLSKIELEFSAFNNYSSETGVGKLEALKAQRTAEVLMKDWPQVSKTTGLIEYLENRKKEGMQVQLQAYRDFKVGRQLKEQQNMLDEHQAMNVNLSNALVLLTEKLSNTRWLILLLVFGLVLFIYNAVLRRQASGRKPLAHLSLAVAERAIEQLMAQMNNVQISTNNLPKRSQAEVSKLKMFTIIAMDFNGVSELNASLGIKAADDAISDKLERIKNLNKQYQILPINGHRYWLVANNYDLNQAQVLVTRIERELESTTPKLSARYELCDVNEPTEFRTILNQLESNLAK